MKRLEEKSDKLTALAQERYRLVQENELRGGSVQDLIKRIKSIDAEYDKISPPVKTVHIPEQDFQKMDNAKDLIRNSDLDWIELYVSSQTGKLTVVLDSEKASNIDQHVIDMVGDDIPLDIKYRKQTMELQAASCASGSTGYCSTVVGGGFIVDDSPTNSIPCTIGLAVEREVKDWWGNVISTEKGIIVPDHCNKGTYMMQNTWNDVADRFGKETDDGGWWCDCDFIKSDGRTIDTTKINNNGVDITINGKKDASVGDTVYFEGSESGEKQGIIVETDVTAQLKDAHDNPIEFSNLYKIKDAKLMSGDSGAPLLDNGKNKFVGMNIGGGIDDKGTPYDDTDDVWYQYGHKWSFLKDRMELKG